MRAAAASRPEGQKKDFLDNNNKPTGPLGFCLCHQCDSHHKKKTIFRKVDVPRVEPHVRSTGQTGIRAPAMCLTCTGGSVGHSGGHAVPLQAVVGKRQQVVVAQGAARVAVDEIVLVADGDGHGHVVVGRGHGLLRERERRGGGVGHGRKFGLDARDYRAQTIGKKN